MKETVQLIEENDWRINERKRKEAAIERKR